MDVGEHKAKKSVWNELPLEVDMIWAEAYMYWSLGEELYLPKEIEKLAEEQQEKHRESYAKEGVIREFLEKKIPSNWEGLSSTQRLQYLHGSLQVGENVELLERRKVCAAEIWQECFGSDIRYMNKKDSMEINQILVGIPGWKKMKSPSRFGIYGMQRGFEMLSTK